MPGIARARRCIVARSLLALALACGLAAAAAPPTVPRLWDHHGSVTTLSFSPDGKKLLSGGAPCAAVWDPATGQRLVAFKGSGVVHTASFSPDGKRVATAGWAGGKPDVNGETLSDAEF